MAVSLAVCLGIGFVNGYLVVRTGLPSFIITLATFLDAAGPQPGPHQGHHRHRVGQRHRRGAVLRRAARRSSPRQVTLFGQTFYIAILWWVVFTIVASYLLLRTRFGNWIFAVGGDENASRNVGVPADGRPSRCS